jgi:hypothetical protein
MDEKIIGGRRAIYERKPSGPVGSVRNTLDVFDERDQGGGFPRCQ